VHVLFGPAVAAVPLLLFLALAYAASRQLRHPSGWVGRRWMASLFNEGNRTMLDAAVEVLDAKVGERIVDVGFGGGYALGRILEQVAPARPAGVEISRAMIDAGRARWGNAVELHLADVTAMPFEAGSCDGVLSVNTLYFWPDPRAALREIRRVLRPDGRLVLGIRRPGVMLLAPMTWFGFRLYSVRGVEELLRAAGFSAALTERARGELVFLALPA
jgi:SAM-dependent methyltransferase